MKFGAIDIGSNGVRLMIARPLDLESLKPEWKKVEYTRLPLRLGDDVFRNREISKRKVDLLTKSMLAFCLLMDIYNVDNYRACATSAMRDAKNSSKIIKAIERDTGIGIEVISGSEESKLIMNSFLHLLDPDITFLHIDVGGGSTELTVIQNRNPVISKSFDIGTVRMRENRVKDEEWLKLQKWVYKNAGWIPGLRAIGTGGNIHKLGNLANVPENGYLKIRMLRQLTEDISAMSDYDRVYHLRLNPDRAEVIDYAGNIYLEILEHTTVTEILTPHHSLKNGIIQDLWETYFSKIQKKV